VALMATLDGVFGAWRRARTRGFAVHPGTGGDARSTAPKEQAVPPRYLTQSEVDALPEGTLIEVRWPGRDWSGTLMILRRTTMGPIGVWAASIPNGYAVGPLNRVGAPGTGMTTVRLAGDSGEPGDR
jgi:hypothetical protein